MSIAITPYVVTGDKPGEGARALREQDPWPSRIGRPSCHDGHRRRGLSCCEWAGLRGERPHADSSATEEFAQVVTRHKAASAELEARCATSYFLQAPPAGHSDHDEDFIEVEILKDATAM